MKSTHAWRRGPGESVPVRAHSAFYPLHSSLNRPPPPRRVRHIARILTIPTDSISKLAWTRIATCDCRAQRARVTGMYDGAIVRANQHIHVRAGVPKTPDHLRSSVRVIQTFHQRHPRMLENFGLLATGGPDSLPGEIMMSPHVLQQDPTSHKPMIWPSTLPSQVLSKKLINTTHQARPSLSLPNPSSNHPPLQLAKPDTKTPNCP
jgi:hypothetical protein